MLPDCLVSGENNEKIQRHLLSEGELTFKRAFEIALSLETIAQHMADLQSTPFTSIMGNASVKKVSSLKKQPPKSEYDKCYRCEKRSSPVKMLF